MNRRHAYAYIAAAGFALLPVLAPGCNQRPATAPLTATTGPAGWMPRNVTASRPFASAMAIAAETMLR